MLSTVRLPCGCLFHLWGLNHCRLHHSHLGILPMTDVCVSLWWPEAHARYALSGCFLLCFKLVGPLLLRYPPAFPAIWLQIQFWEFGSKLPNPSTFLTWHWGIFFPGLVLCNDTVIGGGHETWWFQCSDWVSGWWIYFHLVSRELCCLITHLSWLHRQGVITNLLSTWMWMWMWRLFFSGPSSCRLWARSGFHPHWLSICQNWIHHLRSLMSLLLQSLWGSYTWCVTFLILLNCSLLLASNLINYGARLDHYFCLWHWQVRCQHLNWFDIFPVIQPYLGSSLHHHQITLLWILLIRRLISLSDFQTGIGAAAHSTLDTVQLILIPKQLLLLPLPL